MSVDCRKPWNCLATFSRHGPLLLTNILMRRLIAPFLLLTLLISAAVLPGTAATATRVSTSSSRGAAPSDSQIEATLRGKLAKSKIGKDGFKFHVQHGVVTWD